jgi:DNA-binding SARP family transcriptional activator
LETTVLELKLLGVPELRWQGQIVTAPAPKPFAMLCYLAMQREPCSRKDLAELLWEAGKTGSVRVALAELRNLSGSDEWLVTDDQLVSLKAVTDVKQFENALENENYSEALEICSETKTFLKGLELRNSDNFMNWLELERSRLSELYLTALQGRLKDLERTQNYPEAIKLARNLLEQDKLNEDVHRAVIRLEHERGNDEAALAQFETLRQILKEELDEEPLEETLELLREIEGGSVSRSKVAFILSNPDEIPAKAQKLFGRETLLEETRNLLQNGERVLLQGLGGSGKTALAAGVAEQHLSRKAGSKVLWLQAGDDELEALFDAIARAFDARQTLKDNPKALQDLLAKNKITLFVIDDVWNAYSLGKLLELLPASLQILVTSRQRYPKLKRLDVGRLTREAAIQLLRHHAQALPPLEHSAKGNANGDAVDSDSLGGVSEGRGGSDADTNKLCEVLGDHAFAVRIAGITLAVDGISARELLERIKDAPHTLKIPAEFAETGRESVSSLLSVSLEALSDEAHEALLGCGAMFTSSCTPELLSYCLRRSEEATENALSELQKRGLAERVSEPGSDLVSYRLHDLVFSFARANNTLRSKTAMGACKVFLEKHKQDFNVLDVEISNLMGSLEVAKSRNPSLFVQMVRLLVVGDAYYAARGHSPRSFALHQVAVQKAREIDDRESLHLLLGKLGNAYRELYDDTAKALEVYKEALTLAKHLQDEQSEVTLLGAIGITLFHQNPSKTDYASYLERAYELAKSKRDNVLLSHITHYKGFIALHLEKWEEANLWSREALRLAKELNQKEPEAATNLFFSLLNIGEAEKKLGHLELGRKAREEALQLAREQQNVLWEAYALEGIAEIHHELGEKLEAQRHYQQALELFYENNALSDMAILIQTMKEQNYGIKKEDMVLA